MNEAPVRVTPLSGSDRERLSSSHPEIRDAAAALVIAGSESAVAVIEEFAQSVARQARQSERVLDVLSEDIGTGVLEESRVLQLQRLAAARDRFLKECPTLTSHDISEVNGSRATNQAALANGWKAAGRIFALKVERTDRYPAFQFGDDGKPLPVIATVLEIMGSEKPWSVALWLVAGSGWLGGRRPVDLLRTDPDAVVHAARRATEPLSI
jgi:hypothetical protein